MIETMLQDLIGLDGDVWDSYALRREPLIGKITEEQKREFMRSAHACGEELAGKILRENPGVQPEAYAGTLGLTVEHVTGDGADPAMFACFTEPDRITVFRRTAELAEQLVAEKSLASLLGAVRLEDVLVAHELYHYFEFSMPGLYTGRKLLRLWKIGRLQNWSRLVSLQEIGAMAFAQRLLGLPYSPYVFDVLLLYSRNRRMAKELYESILRHAEGKES